MAGRRYAKVFALGATTKKLSGLADNIYYAKS